MLSRREFVKGSAVAVVAPIVFASGAKADSTPIVQRLDLTKLQPTDPFFSKYADAVAKMHALPSSDPRNWRNQALIHLNYCPHGKQDFVHLHRHYIRNFELICSEIIKDPTFSLSYWNWSSNMGRIPDPFYDLNQLNVEHWLDKSDASSPNWGAGAAVSTVGSRNLVKGQGLQDDPRLAGPFTEKNISSILNLSNFPLFTSRLEGSPHNNGHVIAGGANGHMGDGMSPLDPIFWLHHCNVDRIWAQWQAAGNTTPDPGRDYAGQFVDGKGQPVQASSSSALKPTGYTYEFPHAAASRAAALSLPSAGGQSLLRPQELIAGPKVLGSVSAVKSVRVANETSFLVTATNLSASLFSERTFWATEDNEHRRLAAESGRVVARISGVTAPEEKSAILVNVFVNCPYLSPSTGSDDPHYAGSFSFFGMRGANHQHQFVVDLTDPLKSLFGSGAITSEQIKIQLMPVPLRADEVSTASFSVSGIEVLRA
jgi:tyrosinase